MACSLGNLGLDVVVTGAIAFWCPEIWCASALQWASFAPHISFQYLVYASNSSQFCHGSFIGNPVFPLTYRLNWHYIKDMTECLKGPKEILRRKLSQLGLEFGCSQEEE